MQLIHNGNGMEQRMTMEIRSKLWIEVDGQPVFGQGRRFLLESIEKHGDISKQWKSGLGSRLSIVRQGARMVEAPA